MKVIDERNGRNERILTQKERKERVFKMEEVKSIRCYKEAKNYRD